MDTATSRIIPIGSGSQSPQPDPSPKQPDQQRQQYEDFLAQERVKALRWMQEQQQLRGNFTDPSVTEISSPMDTSPNPGIAYQAGGSSTPIPSIFDQMLRGVAPCSVIYEDAQCGVVWDSNPGAPTHFIVFPKTKLGGIAAMEANDETRIGHLIFVAKVKSPTPEQIQWNVLTFSSLLYRNLRGE